MVGFLETVHGIVASLYIEPVFRADEQRVEEEYKIDSSPTANLETYVCARASSQRFSPPCHARARHGIPWCLMALHAARDRPPTRARMPARAGVHHLLSQIRCMERLPNAPPRGTSSPPNVSNNTAKHAMQAARPRKRPALPVPTGHMGGRLPTSAPAMTPSPSAFPLQPQPEW